MKVAGDAAKAEIAYCFVPELLAKYIKQRVRNGSEKIEPAAFFVEGVCLLVDISGFTKMSEQFCQNGKSGIDSLQLATNGYMGKLTDVIYSYGGDIIKFAGDALVCLFASPDLVSVTKGKQNTRKGSGSVPIEIILKAMMCAHEIRHVRTSTLSVHVGMSCGEMCFGILGGVENSWECLISGPCIHELSDCLDDAPSMHAVMTAACLNILAEQAVQPTDLTAEPRESSKETTSYTLTTHSGRYEIKLLKMPSGNWRIISAQREDSSTPLEPHDGTSTPKFQNLLTSSRQKATIDALIRQFVPAPIVEELDTATGLSYFAEIREVVTMFMKWDSYDANVKHRDLLDLQPCFYQAQRILHVSGAYLRQFLVDDKGCVLIACWGMPNMSYVDNADRALSAAAQIKFELERLGMRTSVGITSADVYCGAVGSARRMEYAAIGSEVNMAARIMGKAKGRLLVGASAYNRLTKSSRDTLEEIEPMVLKGKVEPMEAYMHTAKTTSSKSVRTAAMISDGLDVSPACKTALTALLQSMVLSSIAAVTAVNKEDLQRNNSTSTSIRSTNGSKPGWTIFSGASFRTPSGGARSPQGQMSVVLVNGKEGSGRTSVIVWLKAQAAIQKIPIIRTKLLKKDGQSEYFLCRKLFQQLMPKDLFIDSSTQRSYITVLLHKVYHGDMQAAEHTGYPAMRTALGITCSFIDELHSPPPAMVARKLSKGSWSGSMSTLVKHAQHQAVPIVTTLVRIMSHLLTLHPSLVIVEHIEHADEESLAVLAELLRVQSRSAVVLTALVVDDAQQKNTKIGRFLLSKSYEKDAFNASPWTQRYRGVVERHRGTTTVTLENYTLAEIEKLLASAIGARCVPPDMAHLVQDFAGGSNFWVREIIQSIEENGSEQFMAAADAEKDANGKVKTGAAATSVATAGMGLSMFAMGGSTRTGIERTSGRIKPRRNSITGAARASLRSTGATVRASLQLSRAASSNNFQQGNHSQIQLDKLIVCRFNNLATDVQRILRTASIIGTNFTSPLLLGVLPKHLKEQMSSSIDILVHQKWLFQDLECDTAYEFTHPHAHRLIYQLTPSSERNHMHQAIADYIEETYGVDKSQFAALSYHYQHCDSDKALHYCVQAVSALLESTTVIFDYGECIDLLYGSFVCCKTSFDCEVMHKLATMVTEAVEKCDVTPQQPEEVPTLWQSTVKSFFRALSTLTTLANTPRMNSNLTAISSKSSARYSSNKIVPTVSSRGDGPLMTGGNMTSTSSREHTGDSVKAFNAEDFEERDRDSFRESVKATSDMSNERRSKKEFIEQLDRLHVQINQKQAGIVMMRIGGGEEGGHHAGKHPGRGSIRFGSSVIADAPSDWQLDFLQLT